MRKQVLINKTASRQHCHNPEDGNVMPVEFFSFGDTHYPNISLACVTLYGLIIKVDLQHRYSNKCAESKRNYHQNSN